jgi:hypothetical protein
MKKAMKKLQTFQCQECFKMKTGSRFADIAKEGGKTVGRWICNSCYLAKR